MTALRVLIGYSRDPVLVTALRRLGHQAWTCDILDADHQWHLHADIWDVAHGKWDWALFHPMCTYLTVSAAWAFEDPDFERYPGVGYHQRVQPGTLVGAARREAREQALDNFRRLLALPYPKAIENPAPSFVSRAIRPPDQTVQPYEYGDDASKRTGLWLDRLPRLIPTERIPGRVVNGKERWANQTDSGQNRLSPGPDRWLERSRSYPGMMAAAAWQWPGPAEREAAHG